MSFDHVAARAARAQNPELTTFDTGEQLQPYIHGEAGETRMSGRVDFDNDESATMLTLDVAPAVVDDAMNLNVDTSGTHPIRLVVNGHDVALIRFDRDGNPVAAK